MKDKYRKLIREALVEYRKVSADFGHLRGNPADPCYVLEAIPGSVLYERVEVLVLVGTKDHAEPFTAYFEPGDDPPPPLLACGW